MGRTENGETKRDIGRVRSFFFIRQESYKEMRKEKNTRNDKEAHDKKSESEREREKNERNLLEKAKDRR